ncbi:MAG: Asp-tRNA(Asn)/Glu-tRNA(Gln) amidotransferase subunit GatB [Gemmataceae bacterium]|nr:Asp-tRNA(Asn)/Glu-tRNA(Gln) amidotransferase subunit GatB [Gemmataceae bacterium]MDW8265076.1 Asp-tRNA(Asn)/Glu-tRNA(Gln) amidotransferase subunit GatB [Gemmataceae bacterium]
MADLPYRIVIGLEVHVQLLTKTKLFCGCPNRFGLPPNSATCPVCIGMPGVLPVMNRRAFELALKAALALNCQIAAFTKWDRKNYYYPDLPKNYQISQYDLPFSYDGWLEISTATGPKRVRIIRVHLEEDAGKMLHDEQGGGRDSLVDLNRAGTPLLEIVSHPDMSTPEEAKAYLEEIRLMLRELEVSDCEMQEGSLRCDANVNIHVPLAGGGHAATPIVEVKNLNSFRSVERAIRYEAQRQYEEFQKTGKKLGEVPKATAGWDENRGITVVQRRKEEASDYRYFPEPDLVPVEVDDAWRERIRASLGELPAQQRRRLQEQYGLSAYDANVLTSQGRAMVAYFETVSGKCGDPKAACNWITNKLLAVAKTQGSGNGGPFALPAEHLADLIAEQKAMGLTKQISEELFDLMVGEGLTAKEAIERKGIKPVASADELLAIVRRAIAANPKAVADFKKGKTAAAQAIKGAVMKETKGTAKPDLVQQLVMDELQKV